MKSITPTEEVLDGSEIKEKEEQGDESDEEAQVDQQINQLQVILNFFLQYERLT